MPLDESSYSSSKGYYDIPAPPIPESHHSALKAAGRAFSFGRKKNESLSGPSQASRSAVDHGQSESYARFIRPRAMTESSYASESTATPPKLLDPGLDFDDGFGSMFESFGKRQSKVLEEPPNLGGANTESPVSSSRRVLHNGFADNCRKTCHLLAPGCLRNLTLVSVTSRLHQIKSTGPAKHKNHHAHGLATIHKMV